jgi:hypothetical protein
MKVCRCSWKSSLEISSRHSADVQGCAIREFRPKLRPYPCKSSNTFCASSTLVTRGIPSVSPSPSTSPGAQLKSLRTNQPSLGFGSIEEGRGPPRTPNSSDARSQPHLKVAVMRRQGVNHIYEDFYGGEGAGNCSVKIDGYDVTARLDMND